MARIRPKMNSDRLFTTCSGSSVANAVVAVANTNAMVQNAIKIRFIFLDIFLFLRFFLIELVYLILG